jgi:endogenous inhibitor of DNA gyrase (YacG/DUF329 family)
MVRVFLSSEGGTPMNNLQKEKIVILRANGESYSKIADVLGISINTIKSFCRRNNLGGVASAGTKQDSDALCNQCGAPLRQIAGKKQKKFCSNKCRMAWWNSHPEKINRIAVRTFTCQTCGQDFESYGKRERKYCSRSCYGKSKAVRF